VGGGGVGWGWGGGGVEGGGSSRSVCFDVGGVGWVEGGGGGLNTPAARPCALSLSQWMTYGTAQQGMFA
jgi:hypothetical protein